MQNRKLIQTILAVLLTIGTLGIFSACSLFPQEEVIKEQETPAKEVSIYTVVRTTGHEPNGQPIGQFSSQSQPTSQASISFMKSGQISSGKTAIVVPQIAGKITDIKVKVGDHVSKNQLLLTLGDSLATNVADKSYETALKGIEQLENLKFKTDYSAQKDIEAVSIGYYSAKESLENTIKSKDYAEELYEEQHDLLEDTLDDLENVLDKLEDIPNYEDNATYQETEAKYDQLKSQLNQAEIGHEAQEDQLTLCIDISKRQLESAILAVESVQTKYSLQFIQIDSTILQAKSGADLAKLQTEAKKVTAPITGVITSLQATEDNFTAPGQMLMVIEDLNNLKATTSINEEESKLVKIGDKVTLGTTNGNSSSSGTYEGTITSISPTLSSLNNKIAVEITLETPANLDQQTLASLSPDQKASSSAKLSNQSTPLSGQLVNITFTPNTDSIFIPLNTVTIEDTKYYVKIINSKKEIEKREIEPGNIFDKYIEVLSGLENGDIIATSSTTFLQEGDKVVYKVPRVLY